MTAPKKPRLVTRQGPKSEEDPPLTPKEEAEHKKNLQRIIEWLQGEEPPSKLVT